MSEFNLPRPPGPYGDQNYDPRFLPWNQDPAMRQAWPGFNPPGPYYNDGARSQPPCADGAPHPMAAPAPQGTHAPGQQQQQPSQIGIHSIDN